MSDTSTHVFAFSRPVGTSRKRVSTVANARDTLLGAGWGPGVETDVVTGGQFSLVDLIEAVIEITGPALVDLSTWTAAEFDLTHITQQLTSGRILGLRLIVDRSFTSRAPAFVQAVASRFGEEMIRTTRTHAKFVTVRNDDWSVTIRTSMNLNHNARTEWVQVTADEDLTAFYTSIVDEVFATTDAGLTNRRGVNLLDGLDPIAPASPVRVGARPSVGPR